MSGYEDIFGSISKKIREDEKKETLSTFEWLTILLTVFVFYPSMFLSNGWLVMTVWNWFLPLIGLSTINIPIALGICVFIGIFRDNSLIEKYDEKTAKDKSKALIIWKGVFNYFFKFITTLGVAYAITLFL